MDTTIFSNECYSLSENTLNFQKTITDGATISFDDGQSAVNTCKGLKNKTFELKNNALITQKYAYALTNELGKIIQIEKGNTLQLNDFSLLVYFFLVHHLGVEGGRSLLRSRTGRTSWFDGKAGLVTRHFQT